MVKVTSVWGFDYFYRCTPDGRIQRSSDGHKWRVAKPFRGKRVDMTKHSVAEVEREIADQLGSDADYNMGAIVC